MAAKLRGADDLRKRLRALGMTFKPLGRQWGRETVALSRPQIPNRTGKTRRSLRVRHANMKRATVYGSFVASIIDKGAKPHEIKARKSARLVFQAGGRTIFARSVHHRGVRGKRYAGKAARTALRRVDMAQQLIDQWNRAA
jgi:hypothetical protein